MPPKRRKDECKSGISSYTKTLGAISSGYTKLDLSDGTYQIVFKTKLDALNSRIVVKTGDNYRYARTFLNSMADTIRTSFPEIKKLFKTFNQKEIDTCVSEYFKLRILELENPDEIQVLYPIRITNIGVGAGIIPGVNYFVYILFII